jgi:hypothetical protein
MKEFVIYLIKIYIFKYLEKINTALWKILHH